MSSGTVRETMPLVPAAPVAQAEAAAVFGRRNLGVSAALGATALVVLGLFEIVFRRNPIGVSAAPHYLLQAQALLQGHWYLDIAHQQLWDTISLHGKTYIIYPPFPALLLLPFVAIFGAKTSDVLFTTVLSALNLPIMYLLFEQARASGLTRRHWLEHICISVLLFYGSINLWLSLGGRVWFTAQIICLQFTMLSLLVALRRRFIASALLLGCAFFTRGTIALGFPLLLFLAWQNGGSEHLIERFAASLWARRPDWSAVPWRRLAGVVAVCIALVLLFMARNLAIFGSPLETGYGITQQQNYPGIVAGVYSGQYLGANFLANFFDFPHIIFTSPTDIHPTIDMLSGGYGTSVFLTTPLFFLLFWRNSRFSLLRAALWATIGIFVVEVLLFNATGYLQFGARYLFDAYPYAFLLLVLTEARVDWRFALLGLVAIPINALGAHQFWTTHQVKL